MMVSKTFELLAQKRILKRLTSNGQIAGAFFGLGVYGLYDLLLDRIKDPYLAMIDPMFAMSVLGFTMLLVTLSGMIGFCKGKICLIK